MSENTDSIEIDPEELSDQVVQDLVDEGALDKEDAEKYGDEVWFEEVDVPEPTKKEGLNSIISSKLKGLYTTWRERSAFFHIESVERTYDDRVRLNLFHSKHKERSVVLGLESTTLVNLMALAKVDNPKDLEGGRVVMTENTWSKPELTIPNNLSSYGRIKYKMYSAITHIREKTKIKSLGEGEVFGVQIVTAVSWFIATLGSTFINISPTLAGVLILPALVTTSVCFLLLLYGGFRLVFFALCGLLSTEISRTETRPVDS